MEELKTLIDGGAPELELWEANFGLMARTWSALMRYRYLRPIVSEVDRPLFIEIHLGASAKGKSTAAPRSPDVHWFSCGTGSTGSRWFDGYDPYQHKTLVFDEFTGSEIDYTTLLRLFDNNPFRVEAKGTTVHFVTRRFIFTRCALCLALSTLVLPARAALIPVLVFACSNVHALDWYDLNSAPLSGQAFLRRLRESGFYKYYIPDQVNEQPLQKINESVYALLHPTHAFVTTELSGVYCVGFLDRSLNLPLDAVSAAADRAAAWEQTRRDTQRLAPQRSYAEAQHAARNLPAERAELQELMSHSNHGGSGVANAVQPTTSSCHPDPDIGLDDDVDLAGFVVPDDSDGHLAPNLLLSLGSRSGVVPSTHSDPRPGDPMSGDMELSDHEFAGSVNLESDSESGDIDSEDDPRMDAYASARADVGWLNDPDAVQPNNYRASGRESSRTGRSSGRRFLDDQAGDGGDAGDDVDEVETAEDLAFIDDEDDGGYFGPATVTTW